MVMTIEQLIDDFEYLEDWEDRYQQIIDLGRQLPAFPEEYKTDEYRVRGCVSRVWMVPRVNEGDPPHIEFMADSDAHIVKGLVAILLMIYSGKTPQEIMAVDIQEIFDKLELGQHLSPSRSNGFHAMVKRIRAIADHAMAGAPSPNGVIH